MSVTLEEIDVAMREISAVGMGSGAQQSVLAVLGRLRAEKQAQGTPAPAADPAAKVDTK